MKIDKFYSSDFETTTKEDDCRVWGFTCINIKDTDKHIVGHTIDEFMKFSKKGNQTHYFHNLKFDGGFIIYWLLTHGYKYSKLKTDKTFNILMSRSNQLYSIEVIHKRFEKRYWKTVYYDSFKKLPFSVSRIAKAFKLNISKLEIDYNKERPLDYIMTPEEREYIINDALIVAQALGYQFQQGLNKMTVGSDALNNFKEVVGKNSFKYHFPVLDLEIDEDIRGAYRGGFTYVNKLHQEKDIEEGHVFDVNSIYPAVMYYKQLPYDVPIFFQGQYEYDDEYPLYIQNINIMFKLKKDKIPTIQLKHLRFKETEYLEEVDEVVNMKVTNIDLDLIKQHYDIIYIEYLNGWKFRAKQGLFCEYIDFWKKIKDENTGAMRELAKLMLNSLYGKFASNPDVTGKSAYLEDGIVKYKLEDKELKDPVYTAMGVFITSYARYQTITTAQSVYKNFCYADTDSIHCTGLSLEELQEKIDVDPFKLGAWKHEGKFNRARFIRAKTYIEEYDDHLLVKCAGMPDTLKQEVTFDNFHVGLTLFGKLRPKSVKGGIILEPTTFEIKPH